MAMAQPTRTLDDVALFRHLPQLSGRVPWVRLGQWPTPVQKLEGLGSDRLWVKREDLSSPIYGGNKVRTLEAMMGRAVAAGCDRIWATGAYGSNHAVATVLHASDAGLAGGLAMFPQPRSRPARENLLASLSTEPAIEICRSPLTLPLMMRRIRQRGPEHFVMAPGGATPEGTLGATSAALELAEQIEAGDVPAPARIVLATGSTCTTSGLLVGLEAAARLGLGFGPGRAPLPDVTAVRVTPWPITSVPLILQLASRAARAMAELTGGRIDIGLSDLARRLTLHTTDFGGGYGKITARGWRAADRFLRAGGPPLDVVYSAKSAAAFLDLADQNAPGPLLFWATKSSAPLPAATPAQIDRAPAPMRRWLG